MKEIVPGIFHWSTFHERIRHSVSSYYLFHEGEAVLIDPRVPEDGLEWFHGRALPSGIILTNRHHYRHSGEFAKAFACTVRCHSAGLHEFDAGQTVVPFEFGDDLACGVRALEVASLCPDETALYIPWARAVAFADGLVRMPFDGPLGFVPDPLMGDDPAAVKAGLLEAFGRVLDLDFDTILLAHGAPWVGSAKDALSAFVRSAGAAPATSTGDRSHPHR